MSDVSRRLAELSPEKRALLAKHLGATAANRGAPGREDVAIIGLGCRFPGGANSPEAFWDRLVAGVNAVGPTPADRWDRDAYHAADAAVPGNTNTRWGAFLEGVDRFDAAFFGISPREASSMDPQQRLLLEVAWEALEDAGQLHVGLAGSATGVFVGVHSHSIDYFLMQAGELEAIDIYTTTGTAHSILANRLSFFLDLQGPSLAIDTACSSSLVAAHLACQSLRAGESDLALACGVNLILSPQTSLALAKLEMLAADGRCKTFDASANGFVRGEGCGVVVLKRLDDALRDRDRIVAVIRGFAVNQDGATNGLTAPNGLSQTRVLRRALANAALEPSRISYIETHGTGTALGDPIEVEALATIYGRSTTPGQPCYLGAVKTNIGHLEGAAGIAGLIKAALCLDQKVIPPNLHFTALNPHIILDGTSFVIPTRLEPWSTADGQSRCAAVSSFGFGGTNAHLILEEAPTRPPDPRPQTLAPAAHILPLSARSDEALRALAGSYVTFLADPLGGARLSVGDIAYTASVRRLHHRHRLAFIGHSHEEWIKQLERFLESDRWSLTDPQAADNAKDNSRVASAGDERYAMLEAHAKLYAEGLEVDWGSLHQTGGEIVLLPRYPWQRNRYWIAPSKNRGLEIGYKATESGRGDWFYEIEWQFKPNLRIGLPREAPDYLPEPAVLAARMTSSLAQFGFPSGHDDLEDLVPKLEALAVRYIARGLADFGLRFDRHARLSIELLSRHRGIRAHHRCLLGRLFEILEQDGVLRPDGGLWEVVREPDLRDPQAQWEELRDAFPVAGDALEVFERCASRLADVLRGNRDPLELLFPEAAGASAETLYQNAPFARAANMLIGEAIEAALNSRPEDRTLRVLEIGAGTGGTTGDVLPRFPAGCTEYVFTDVSDMFLRKAREKFNAYHFVRFERLDIEQSPPAQGFGLHQFDLIIAANALHATTDLRRSLTHVRDLLAPGGLLILLEGTAPRHWVDLSFGLTEGWWRFTDERLRPSYPLLSRQRWESLLAELDFAKVASTSCQAREGTALFDQAVIIAREPAPRRDVLPGEDGRSSLAAISDATNPGQWLIFTGGRAAGEELAALLSSRGDLCTLVAPGEAFEVMEAGRYRIRPECLEDYRRLLEAISGCGNPPCRAVVYLCDVSAEMPNLNGRAEWEALENKTCGAAVLLTQAVLASGLAPEHGLWLVTCGAQTVAAAPGVPAVEQAALWGLGRVIASEHPELWGGLIDLDSTRECGAAHALLAEIEHSDGEDQIALRRGDRHVARLVRRGWPESPSPRLSTDGAYLVTGGLGGLGFQVARWLASHGARHLVLLGRRRIPSRTSWPSISLGQEGYGMVAAIQAIERLGATVDVVNADVSDDAQMATVLSRFGAEIPPLRGIVHAAGTVASSPLESVTLAELHAICRPKMAGSWILHKRTLQHRLDFFVLFSSGASCWGAKEMASYAAANHFLDALAHYRRAHGLPALTINWGWFEGGATTDQNHRFFDQIGLRMMRSDDCLNAMGQLIVNGAVQAAVASIDWAKFAPIYMGKRDRHFLRRVAPLAGTGRRHESSTIGGLGQRIRLAPIQEAREILDGHVRHEVARLLGIEPGRFIEASEGFFKMGMDSITSVQLRNRLEVSLECALPLTVAFEYPHIEALCGYLSQALGLSSAGETAQQCALAGPTSTTDDTSEAGDLDECSEEDLAEMLDQEIGRLIGPARGGAR